MSRPRNRIADLCGAAQRGEVAEIERILDVRPELVGVWMAEDDERRAIHFAVIHEQPGAVRALMAAGASASGEFAAYGSASAPLVIAEERGLVEIATIIREELARRESSATSAMPAAPRNDDTRDDTDHTTRALRDAIQSGEIDVLRGLAAEAGERFRSIAGSAQLLSLAVERACQDVVRVLLELGADPDERRRLPEYEDQVFDQGLPLWIAAGEGHHEIAVALLEHGADADAEVYASGTPLSRAYRSRDERMKALLSKHGASLTPDLAALEGELEAMEELLAENPSIAAEHLATAACGGNPRLVASCLRHVKRLTDGGRDALEQTLRFWRREDHRKYHDVPRENYLEIFRILLDHPGADVNNPAARYGYRPLHFLATADGPTDGERLQMARMLLDRGASLDALDELLRSTPLGWAARWGRGGLVELLLEKGADPKLAGAPWATPLAWAEKKGHPDIAKRLRRAGA